MIITRKILSLSVVLAAAAAPAAFRGAHAAAQASVDIDTAAARKPPPPTPFALALESQTEWQLDGAHRLFDTSRSDTGTGLSLSYDLGRLGQGATAAVAVAWNHRESSAGWGLLGPDGQLPSTNRGRAGLALDTASLSFLLRWSMGRWLEPHLRLAVDGTRADVTVEPGDGQRFSDRAWSAGASAGAGFRLRTRASRLRTLPGDPAFALAALAEGGFHAGLPLAIAVSPPRPADEKVAADSIPTAATRLGDLGRSFPYLKLSLALLF